MSSAPPQIFSNARRDAALRRSEKLREADQGARFIYDDMAEDMLERLGFVQHVPTNSLLLGHPHPSLKHLQQGGFHQSELLLEVPYPQSGFDFIGCLGVLDTVNDLPGALIHMNRALASGGLAIASFVGAGSLSTLRRIMLAADGERPAPRIHPHIDIQAASDLIQRAGWADPVVDSHRLKVRYPSLQWLVQDLREQGLGNVLSARAPYLGKAGFERAGQAFAAEMDADGRVTESFEIITLTGRRK